MILESKKLFISERHSTENGLTYFRMFSLYSNLIGRRDNVRQIAVRDIMRKYDFETKFSDPNLFQMTFFYMFAKNRRQLLIFC